MSANGIVVVVFLGSLAAFVGCGEKTLSPSEKPSTSLSESQPSTDHSWITDTRHVSSSTSKNTLGTNPQSGRTDLSVRFVYGGPAPRLPPIRSSKGVAFCGDPSMKDVSLLVDPATRGVKNVLLVLESPQLETGVGSPETASGHKILCDGCQFTPHVSLLRVGQTIEVVNQDVIGHAVQIGFFTNPVEVTAIPIGRHVSVAATQPEPVPVEVSSQFYPWMKAHLMVVNHGRVGLSDSQGRLTIKDLPVGIPLTFRLWHERGDFDDVLIGDQPVALQHGRFTVTLESSSISSWSVMLSPGDFKRAQ